MLPLPSLSQQVISSIHDMKPSNTPALHLNVLEPISETIVRVTLTSEDDTDSLKLQIQDALGISSEYINLNYPSGIPVSTAGLNELLRLGTLSSEKNGHDTANVEPDQTTIHLHFQVDLKGGFDHRCNCGHITCCERSFEFGAMLRTCCCWFGRIPSAKVTGNEWGCRTFPLHFGCGGGCCRMCDLQIGSLGVRIAGNTITTNPLYGADHAK